MENELLPLPCIFNTERFGKCTNCENPDTAEKRLKEAIIAGDETVFQEFIFSCLRFSFHYEDDGKSPLTVALENDRTDFAWQLIGFGADVNAADKNSAGWAPIHYAAQNNQHNFLFGLIRDHGVHADTRDGESLTPLHHAVKGDHYHSVTALVQLGADINAITDCRWSPIFYAAQRRDSATVRYLLNVATQCYDQQCICGIFLFDKLRLVGYNFDTTRFTNPDSRINLFQCDWGHYPIVCAVHDNNVDNVTKLCDVGADVNVNTGCKEEPLIFKAISNAITMPLKTQKQKAEVNHALHIAVTLLNHNAKVGITHRGLTPVEMTLLKARQSRITIRLEVIENLIYMLISTGGQLDLQTSQWSGKLITNIITKKGRKKKPVLGDRTRRNSWRGSRTAAGEQQNEALGKMVNRVSTYLKSVKPLDWCCRLTIRKSLYKCKQSSKSLPLPTILKDFIDLKEFIPDL